MSMRSRITLGAAVAVAFISGLVFASGFNLTRFSWAQSSPQFRTAALTPPASVKAATDFSDAFEWVANTVTPAVVSIQAETQPKRRTARTPQNLPPGMEQFFHQFQQQPDNTPQESSGTGFIVSRDGYILTNNHVVADAGELADKLTVKLLDNRTFTAKVIGRDPTTDVALIKIDANDLPTVSLGDDSSARIGQWVEAIGNPLGLNFTVTAGIVSAKGRQLNGLLNTRDNQYAIMDYIQTDAAINPGNSGGPLVNLQGQVIGINSALASGTGYYAGYGFAIPISLARKVMDDFIKYGHVRRAVLGVSIGEVDPATAKTAGMSEIRGAWVQSFTDDNGESPAKKAGVEQGDVIISVDGHPIDKVATLQRVIRNYEPGQTVKLEIMRYGKDLTIPVKLGEPPASATATLASNNGGKGAGRNDAMAETQLGISVAQLTDALAQQDTVPPKYRNGLMVTDVSPSGPAYPDPSAASSGLFPNSDIIVGSLYPKRMDIKNMADLNTAVGAVKKGDYLQLRVYNWQAGQTRLVNVLISK
ncbi:MAG TPA: Do family serine endopeptidase [Gemmatimonadaceae bacterium]|nr:Do family serine endopeptidase [Gemmatimonadaceae bacterium]